MRRSIMYLQIEEKIARLSTSLDRSLDESQLLAAFTKMPSSRSNEYSVSHDEVADLWRSPTTCQHAGEFTESDERD